MTVVDHVESADSPDIQEFYDRIERTSGGLGVLNVFKVMAHSPELMRSWWDMMMVALARLSLDARLRELAILRVFQVLRCGYGFAHHVRLAKRMGLTTQEIEALAQYESAREFSEVDRIVLRYTDSVTALRPDAPDLARELLAYLRERDLVELTFCIANWNLMARLVNPLSVELEPPIIAELPPWWSS
jgi:AhpD family alkylhydroperoxidase